MTKLLFSIAILLSALPATAQSRRVMIPDGTEIRLRMAEPISSATAQIDDRVRMEVAEDVRVNGVLIIKKGAAARGTVIEAEHKRSFGRAGKLNFTVDSVKAVNGENIRLRGTKTREGEGNKLNAGVATYLFAPAGFFVKGKDIEIKEGVEFPAYVADDSPLQIASR
ncbi:MAG TPA: hypothetical protein VG866_00285 [Candidatus Paceibacterota bacterium]|nr:hypothetical protein [Candidatus Paceibacterota bacterium]